MLILIIWAQRQQSESAETADLVQDRRWWGMLAAMCGQRRQDSCGQKQAWAAARGRWYGTGVNLPINGKDIGTGRLNQNMNSPSIKSCTVVWEMQSKRRTKVRKDRERKSKWSWLTCYPAKQLESSLKTSEDSKAHKGSDIGSLDLGPLLEKLKQTTSFSLEKLGPTRIWLKEIKQKYISWQPDNLNSIYTVQQNRSHLNSHCRTNDFYLFIYLFKIYFFIDFSDIPRYQFGHFINDIKTEKGKEYGKKQQLIYFILKPLLQHLLFCMVGQNIPWDKSSHYNYKSYSCLCLDWSWSFMFKTTKKPWKSYQC